MSTPLHSGGSSGIVSAFPATGKTYYAERHPNVLDSDSSSFSWISPDGFLKRDERQRHPDWPHNYIRHIKEQVHQGKLVLVSTHGEVRGLLEDQELSFTLVYPAFDLRTYYLKRMVDRGSPRWLVDKIDLMWPSMLAELEAQRGCRHVVLRRGEYLSDALEANVRA